MINLNGCSPTTGYYKSVTWDWRIPKNSIAGGRNGFYAGKSEDDFSNVVQGFGQATQIISDSTPADEFELKIVSLEADDPNNPRGAGGSIPNGIELPYNPPRFNAPFSKKIGHVPLSDIKFGYNNTNESAFKLEWCKLKVGNEWKESEKATDSEKTFEYVMKFKIKDIKDWPKVIKDQNYVWKEQFSMVGDEGKYVSNKIELLFDKTTSFIPKMTIKTEGQVWDTLYKAWDSGTGCEFDCQSEKETFGIDIPAEGIPIKFTSTLPSNDFKLESISVTKGSLANFKAVAAGSGASTEWTANFIPTKDKKFLKEIGSIIVEANKYNFVDPLSQKRANLESNKIEIPITNETPKIKISKVDDCSYLSGKCFNIWLERDGEVFKTDAPAPQTEADAKKKTKLPEIQSGQSGASSAIQLLFRSYADSGYKKNGLLATGKDQPWKISKEDFTVTNGTLSDLKLVEAVSAVRECKNVTYCRTDVDEYPNVFVPSKCWCPFEHFYQVVGPNGAESRCKGRDVCEEKVKTGLKYYNMYTAVFTPKTKGKCTIKIEANKYKVTNGNRDAPIPYRSIFNAASDTFEWTNTAED